MAIVAKHGKNSLIYINGSEVIGANAWSLSVDHEAAEYAVFGDDWKSNLSGLLGWSGSVTAWSDHDAKILQTAAVYDGTLPLLVYDDRTDNTTYYSGNAIFGFSSDAGMAAVVGQSASFTGSGELSVTGFSA
jgi:hypothetical protein